MNRIGAPIVADQPLPNLQKVLKRYCLGPFELDPDSTVLTLHGEDLALGPKVTATLLALVERAGDLVTKDEILDRVWAGSDVGESNVAQTVYTLRKVLRQHGVESAIVTVPRRGYRYTGTIEVRAVLSPARTHATAGRPTGSVRNGFRWVTAAMSAALVFLAAAPASRAVVPPPMTARGAELYRLGRYFWNLRTAAGLAKSARLFAAVVASDPRNPLGYAGQADVDLMFADYRRDRVGPARHYARARTEIRRALALDAASAPARTSLAMLKFAANHDARGSEAEFRRAIALDPGYAVAHHWYGTILLQQGQLAEASRELHAAAALDPVSSATGTWLSEASYYGRRYHDAIVYARRALDLDPQRADALRGLGLAYELQGDLPNAISAFERLAHTHPGEMHAPALLAEAYARAGRRTAAKAALRDALRVQPQDDDTAFAMLALGDRRGLALLKEMDGREKMPGLDDPRSDPFRTALRQLQARHRATT